MSDEGNKSLDDGEKLPELRKAYDTLKSEHETLQTEHRTLLATTTFKEAKLDPTHAELFLKVVGDDPITAEAATEFAKKYNLPLTENKEGGKTEDPPTGGTVPPEDPSKEPGKGLEGMSKAGSVPAGSATPVSGVPKMSVSEFADLLSKDSATAIAKYQAGEVEHAEGNVAATEALRRGDIKG
jgi:hypothetical protein